MKDRISFAKSNTEYFRVELVKYLTNKQDFVKQRANV